VWIGVVACALIGVGILIYTVYQRRRMEASDNWPLNRWGTANHCGV
jgi:hypothetical protein